jgi:transcriptional regulator with GAF, ATPase, and Fis domain
VESKDIDGGTPRPGRSSLTTRALAVPRAYGLAFASVTEKEHQSGKGEPSAEDHGTTQGQDELAEQLSQFARSLEAEDDPDRMLAEVVAAAVALIPGVDEGSLSVVLGRTNVSSRHPSSDLPRQVDAVQTEVGEGPCLDAVFEQQTVRVPDMTHEERWPRFAQRASEIGAASMLSFQLYVDGDNLGALNLYSRRPNAFTDESEHVGLLFASHAAIAFADARKVQQLQHGLVTRDLIGQAKGILMERFKITSAQAFTVLVRVSQHSNRKLRDVAEELANTGQLPGSQAWPPERAPALSSERQVL